MENEVFIVATIKPWNIKVYEEVVSKYPGEWHLIGNSIDLNIEHIKEINPKYVFFPHWSNIVPDEIINLVPCICFHGADLPYGRGGSPIQNLISRGYRETVISALKMTKELDAGPIYLKRPLSLEGLAEEIFIRAAYIIAEMIKSIITDNPIPKDQVGEPTFFKRRKPNESEIATGNITLKELFDHIRMLDAESYPRAFIRKGAFRYEISRPALKSGEIIADVRITKTNGENND